MGDPTGEYFDYYIDARTGEEYYGDQITFPSNVDILSYVPGSFPDRLCDHFVASYSSNPGGASTNSYYRINVTGSKWSMGKW